MFRCFVLMTMYPAFVQAQTLDAWITDNFSPNQFFEHESQGYVNSDQILGNSISAAVASGDLNGDGSLDVAVANDGACYVYFNDGAGTFQRQNPFGAGLSICTTAALGYVDDNATLDLVLGCMVGMESGPNLVFLNDGSGTFTPHASLGNANTRSLALADLNGDHQPDIFVANDYGESDRVWLNVGSGNFIDSGQILGAERSRSVALGDLDGNDTMDAVVAHDGAANRIWFNDGSGTMSPSSFFGANNSLAVCLADLNGDASLDVVFGQDGALGESLEIWFNDGSGVFTVSTQVFPNPRTLAVTLCDIDRDGFRDLILGNAGADEVWLKQGAGTFALWQSGLNEGYSSSIATGYFRADADEILSSWAPNQWTIIDLLRLDQQLNAHNDWHRGR